MKIATRYEIRIYAGTNGYSKPAFRKLIDRKRAANIVKRLRRSGYEAFYSPIKVFAKA